MSDRSADEMTAIGIMRVPGYCPMGCGQTLFLAAKNFITCGLYHPVCQSVGVDLLWALCKDVRRGYVKAESTDFDRIVVRMPDLIDDEAVILRLSRKDARLLARRLNQCLDATRRP